MREHVCGRRRKLRLRRTADRPRQPRARPAATRRGALRHRAIEIPSVRDRHQDPDGPVDVRWSCGARPDAQGTMMRRSSPGEGRWRERCRAHEPRLDSVGWRSPRGQVPRRLRAGADAQRIRRLVHRRSAGTARARRHAHVERGDPRPEREATAGRSTTSLITPVARSTVIYSGMQGGEEPYSDRAGGTDANPEWEVFCVTRHRSRPNPLFDARSSRSATWSVCVGSRASAPARSRAGRSAFRSAT